LTFLFIRWMNGKRYVRANRFLDRLGERLCGFLGKRLCHGITRNNTEISHGKARNGTEVSHGEARK
jgi:hypothetical protein